MFTKTKGATIKVANKTYHTFNDLDLIITNAVQISDPEQNTSFIEIYGRNSLLDASESLTGYPTYKSRKIEVELAGIDQEENWDGIISEFRNIFDGKIIEITFDNDKAYFWKGRCHITSFDREMSRGKFKLSIPSAEPYKYEVTSSAEPWLWNPFSFRTGVIKPTMADLQINGSLTITLPRGYMPTTPNLIAKIHATDSLSVTYNNRTFDLTNGRNRFPSIKVNGTEEVELKFDGIGQVTIEYRGGSL